MNFRNFIKDKVFLNTETNETVDYWSLPESDRIKFLKQFHDAENVKKIQSFKKGKLNKATVEEIQAHASLSLGIEMLNKKDRKEFDYLKDHILLGAHADFSYRELKNKASNLGYKKIGWLWNKFGGNLEKISLHLKKKGATETLSKIDAIMLTK